MQTPGERPFAELCPGPTRRYPKMQLLWQGHFFDQKFIEDIWEMIVQETTRYYEQKVAAEPNKKETKWSPRI